MRYSMMWPSVFKKHSVLHAFFTEIDLQHVARFVESDHS